MSQSFIQETCSEFEPFVHLILFSSLARQKQVGIITHIGLSMPFSLFFSLVQCGKRQVELLRAELHLLD